MSEDLCSISITGRLGKDPESKRVGDGSVLEFSVAKGSDGHWGDVATWYRVSLFGKRGDGLAKILAKGRQVAVSGTFIPRSYQDKAGAPKVSYDINATSVVPLGSKADNESRPAARPTHGLDPRDDAAPAGDDGGCPF
jgi:single-strand DNA-binding protein